MNFDRLQGLKKNIFDKSFWCSSLNCHLVLDFGRLLVINEIRSIEDHFIVFNLEVDGVMLRALVDSGASEN